LFEAWHLLETVRTYHGFGVHRTGHPGDLRTSDWLAAEFSASGLEVSRHEWTLPQFFLDEASIDDGGAPGRQRIEAFPLWLPRATPREGLRARLVRVPDVAGAVAARGAVAFLDPDGGAEAQRGAFERAALDAGAAGIVFATGDRAGTGRLVAQNAERRFVDTPRPVPTVTFGSASAPRLREAVGREVTLRITGRMEAAARAVNVTGRLLRDAARPWMVVSTPSSGWFTCGGERGPGIAIQLALARWAAARPDSLNYLFVATSGHELDFLGARLYHAAGLAPPPARTRAWLHLGASIATPPWERVDGELRPAAAVTGGLLQATQPFAGAMQAAFAHLPMYRLRTDTRVGEFRDLVEHGYEGMGVVGGSNPWFHVPGDPPEAVCARTLEAVARATADALRAAEAAAA
jgi:hypothetical protein